MSKQKKIREYFESFPEPFRTQAIDNTSEFKLEDLHTSAREALYAGFAWVQSPQGHDHWEDFKNTLKD